MDKACPEGPYSPSRLFVGMQIHSLAYALAPHLFLRIGLLQISNTFTPTTIHAAEVAGSNENVHTISIMNHLQCPSIEVADFSAWTKKLSLLFISGRLRRLIESLLARFRYANENKYGCAEAISTGHPSALTEK